MKIYVWKLKKSLMTLMKFPKNIIDLLIQQQI